VLAVALTADGKTVATGAGDKTIRLWDADKGTELHRLDTGNPVLALAFAPDGKTLAAAGRDGVSLWDVASSKERRRVPAPGRWVRAVAFSPDGKTLAFGSANFDPPPTGRVVLLDLESGRERRLSPGDSRPTEAVAFSPDGRTLAVVGGHDSTLHLWDVASGREVFPVGGHQGALMDAIFLEGGRQAVTGGGDDTVRLWEVATGREMRRLPGNLAGVLPDGRTLLTVVGNTDRELVYWDRATGGERRRLALGVTWPQVLDPRGTVLAVADKDHAIRLIDTGTGKERGRLAGHRGRVMGMSFSADGRRLASVSMDDKKAFVWDVEAVRKLHQFPHPAHMSVALSPDGGLLALGGDDEGVEVWDLRSGRRRLHLKNTKPLENWTRACCVRFSPDGRTLATGCMNTQVRLWEVATGEERWRIEGCPAWVTCVAFSADGRQLLAGGLDTAALVWDLTAGLKEPTAEQDWADLASDDPQRAYAAVRAAAAFPTRLVPSLVDRLRPVPRDEEATKRLPRLIADLDSDRFDVREKAARELDRMGEAAIPALEKMLAGKPSPEVRRRAEALVARWSPAILSGDRLREVRAIEALELAGTPEARRLLEALAGSDEGFLRTREAKAALDRLAPHRVLPRSR
jgi:WD40 repeat protein